jgi:anti-sigma factor RsiW
MTITRDIVRDLMPAYWSGEATADTRAAVESYFAQDPAFAEEARREAEALRHLGSSPSQGSEPSRGPEKARRRVVVSIHVGSREKTLERTKSVLRRQRILFALASSFTLNALSLGFSFQVEGGGVRVRWLALPGQGVLVVVAALIAAVLWIFYVRIHRRVRDRVIG